MKPFVTVCGPAAPLPMDDVDTDQIIPSPYLKDLHADLGQGLLAYMRRRADGSRIENFVLERPAYAGAPILLVGSNFGCGSSREHAVWALQAFGVRCVIGQRPAEFFVDNCLKNGVLPIALDAETMQTLMTAALACDGQAPYTVDLQAQEIRGPANLCLGFSLPAAQRHALLEGLDDIGLTLQQLGLIEAWERHHGVPA